MPRLSRRGVALALPAWWASRAVRAAAPTPATPAALAFPDGWGSHPSSRIEWWYLTGALDAEGGGRAFGFQLTFFRAATGLDGAAESRFQASQLIVAHAAVTDVAAQRLRHDQRIARAGFGIAEAARDRTAVSLRDWSLLDTASAATAPRAYRARASSSAAGFALDVTLATSGPPLLQGRDGLSQKGPDPAQSSRYYSEPQLAATGTLGLDGAPPLAVAGRAWLDHEWSDSLLAADAVGWDWIGMNLDDGAALTAFRLRRADGSPVWAGGSFRAHGATAVRDFAPGEVRFTPGRRWTSERSKASYPVQWTVATPAGTFSVEALLDGQELDALASTGAIYWEGLSALLDASGRRVGRGYLEMTGYAKPLSI